MARKSFTVDLQRVKILPALAYNKISAETNRV
jgi:hypothetical protein